MGGDDLFSTDWLASKIAAGVCDVTGLAFDMSRREGGWQNPLAPSIDRIDPQKGYSQGNVQVVVFAFNTFKGCMPHGEAVLLLKRMAENL